MAIHNPNESGYIRGWRPFLSWTYGGICIFDFIVAPIMMVLYAGITGNPVVPWVSLTMQYGGMFHMSFGAFATVTSWGRREEKLKFLEATREKLNETNATIKSVIK